jgi:hypothetical protein
MKMKRLHQMVLDDTFEDYKLAFLTAQLYKDKAFRYRGETITTQEAKLEIQFVETFLDSIKTYNNDHNSRNTDTRL